MTLSPKERGRMGGLARAKKARAAMKKTKKKAEPRKVRVRRRRNMADKIPAKGAATKLRGIAKILESSLPSEEKVDLALVIIGVE